MALRRMSKMNKLSRNYKKIFSKVLAAKLNGRIKTKQDEIALIRKLKR